MAYDELLKEYYKLLNRNDLSKMDGFSVDIESLVRQKDELYAEGFGDA